MHHKTHPNNLTGLELMQAMLREEIPRPAMSDTIPMKGVLAEQGRVIFEVKADQRHLNVHGGIHGGFAASVLDSTTGSAIHTMLDAGVAYATIDLNIKMCKPIPIGLSLFAEGTIINLSKSLGIADGTLKDDAGKLYAYASTTCMIIK